MQQQVLSISQINDYIRQKLDVDPMLRSVAVRGEISNYKVYPSGHHYFTLKDENASLKCMIYKSSAMRLRFYPENGMQVIALGKISVYPRDGVYQLYVSAMSMDGIGDLYARFEQLKQQLSAKGLFDPAHKKPLPKYPSVIGIVTSEAGAAVHDMIRVTRARYPLTTIKLLPVRVQGAEAPAEIAAAIQYANHYRLCDVLIVGRGGGSIEDLWAFNEECVAYAIYHSQIPVISAVGHEPDVTIADYVADVRAATPSNAAELAVQDSGALIELLDARYDVMRKCLLHQMNTAKQRLTVLSQTAALRSPTGYLEKKAKDLELIKNRLLSAQTKQLALANERYIALTAKLDAMSPLKVLARGYAMAENSDGALLRSVNDAELGERISIRLNDGSLSATVMDKKEF